MIAAPSTTYTNDLVGNRSSETASGVTTSYTWDVLDRMTGRSNSSFAGTYTYRSDGLRTKKSVVTSSVTTVDAFRYDGQMPIEDERISGTTVNATRSTLGVRGIDAEEAVSGTYNSSTGARTLGTASIAYPLYDAHGNRICALSRSGTNYFSTDTPRYYGAWGEVRVGGATGGSISRHCANLGHVQDDESGLIYMRARYYEPGSGRFISQDRAKHGHNYFYYCDNDPLQKIDKSGELPEQTVLLWLADLETACYVSPEARLMLTVACVEWESFLAVSTTNPLDPLGNSLFERLQQQRFVAEAWIVAESPGVVGTPGDRARAEATVQSIRYLVDFWIIGEGGNLF